MLRILDHKAVNIDGRFPIAGRLHTQNSGECTLRRLKRKIEFAPIAATANEAARRLQDISVNPRKINPDKEGSLRELPRTPNLPRNDTSLSLHVAMDSALFNLSERNLSTLSRDDFAPP